MPILDQYNPGLIKHCTRARELSETLVKNWLSFWMLKDQTDDEIKKISKDLAEHDLFQSHFRHMARDSARDVFNLVVDDLEDDQILQDLVLSIYHATTITFQTGVLKIIENHLGKAFVKSLPPVRQLNSGRI